MKTTLELPDDLLRRTKALAALRGVSMRELIAQALEAELKPAGRGSGWCRLIGRARGLDTKPVKRAIEGDSGASRELSRTRLGCSREAFCSMRNGAPSHRPTLWRW